jgi:chromatin remodeling complex protein RSC6
MATKAASAMGSGLNRTIQVSPALQKFLGVGECSRPESMKRVWDYIRDQKLQVDSLCAVLIERCRR